MNLKFDLKRGLIMVPSRLWGPTGDTVVQLVLDTGANGSILSWDTATLLGYDPAIVSKRTRLTTASGTEYAPVIEIDKIEALGQTKHNFLFVCHTLPSSALAEGVLGLDYYRNLKLILDFRIGLVTVE